MEKREMTPSCKSWCDSYVNRILREIGQIGNNQGSYRLCTSLEKATYIASECLRFGVVKLTLPPMGKSLFRLEVTYR